MYNILKIIFIDSLICHPNYNICCAMSSLIRPVRVHRMYTELRLQWTLPHGGDIARAEVDATSAGHMHKRMCFIALTSTATCIHYLHKHAESTWMGCTRVCVCKWITFLRYPYFFHFNFYITVWILCCFSRWIWFYQQNGSPPRDATLPTAS